MTVPENRPRLAEKAIRALDLSGGEPYYIGMNNKTPTKQHVIVVKTKDRIYYVRDQRSTRPTYAHFDATSLDRATIAPGRKQALEVAQAYKAWSAKFVASGLAIAGDVVVRPLPEAL